MMIKLISFPAPSQYKVAGIKSLRAAFGIGLKEAKDLIESLQEGITSQLETNTLDGLDEFLAAGGKIESVDAAIIDQLTNIVSLALTNKSYDIATDIIEILKKHN